MEYSFYGPFSDSKKIHDFLHNLMIRGKFYNVTVSDVVSNQEPALYIKVSANSLLCKDRHPEKGIYSSSDVWCQDVSSV